MHSAPRLSKVRVSNKYAQSTYQRYSQLISPFAFLEEQPVFLVPPGELAWAQNHAPQRQLSGKRRVFKNQRQLLIGSSPGAI